MRPVFLFLAFAALLGGCAVNGSVIIQDTFRQRTLESFYQYGAGGRDLKLVVSGNPFNMQEDVFAQKVEQAMPESTGLSPATRPRLNPDASARSNYSLVFAFQPPRQGDASDLCSGRVGTVRPDQPVVLDAALCISGFAYSFASGRVVADSPDDPRFKSLISQMILTLFYSDGRLDGGNGPIVD